MRNRVPNIVILALYGVAAVALGFTGYAAALERRQWRPAVYITGGSWPRSYCSSKISTRPSTGFITVSQQPMADVAANLAGYSD